MLSCPQPIIDKEVLTNNFSKKCSVVVQFHCTTKLRILLVNKCKCLVSFPHKFHIDTSKIRQNMGIKTLV